MAAAAAIYANAPISVRLPYLLPRRQKAHAAHAFRYEHAQRLMRPMKRCAFRERPQRKENAASRRKDASVLSAATRASPRQKMRVTDILPTRAGARRCGKHGARTALLLRRTTTRVVRVYNQFRAARAYAPYRTNGYSAQHRCAEGTYLRHWSRDVSHATMIHALPPSLSFRGKCGTVRLYEQQKREA